MKDCRFENNGVISFGLVESAAGRDAITAVIQSPESNAELRPESITPLARSCLVKVIGWGAITSANGAKTLPRN